MRQEIHGEADPAVLEKIIKAGTYAPSALAEEAPDLMNKGIKFDVKSAFFLMTVISGLLNLLSWLIKDPRIRKDFGFFPSFRLIILFIGR